MHWLVDEREPDDGEMIEIRLPFESGKASFGAVLAEPWGFN